jgi:hypothetical protein
MSAGDLAVVLAAVLCALGFAALVLVLARVLQALREIRAEVVSLRAETQPLLADLATAVEDARDDLDRFDRVLGSAEAISANVAGASRVTRMALSTPVIKTVALASGTTRAASRLRRRDGAR